MVAESATRDSTVFLLSCVFLVALVLFCVLEFLFPLILPICNVLCFVLFVCLFVCLFYGTLRVTTVGD